MLKSMLGKKHSVIFTWLFSYVMVLLVPVIITAVTYVLTVGIVEKEIVNSNQYLLKRVQQQMDDLLNDAGRLIQEITLDSRISNYFTGDNSQKFQPYELFQLVQNLKFHQLLNQTIYVFFIYFKQADMIVSPNGAMDSRSYYQSYYSKSGTTYEQWKELISTSNGGEFITVSYENENHQNIRTIALTRSVPLFKENAQVNVVILLDESRFMEDVRNIGSLNKGTMMILDKHHRVLAISQPESGKTDLGRDFIKSLTKSNDVLHTRIGDKNVVVSYMTSEVLEWKYIAIIPNSVFWEKADYVRKLTFLSLLICILSGGLITFYALKKNYDPISNLVRSLKNYNGSDIGKMGNEFSFIKETIAKVQTDLEKRDTILAQQNKALREHLLSRLMTGKEGTKIPVEESLVLNNIAFKSDYFAVMAFYIEDFTAINGLENKTGENNLLVDYKNVQALIVKVVEELIGDKNTAYPVYMDDMLVWLVNFDQAEVSNCSHTLLQVVTEAQKLLENNLNIHFMVSVSTIHKTLAGIPEAYSEALQALEYKKLLGIKEIVLYEDIKELPKGSYYYPLEKEQQLINCIKAGNCSDAKAIVDEIFRANFDQTILPPQIGKCLLLDLVSTMLKTLNEVSEMEQLDFSDGLNLVDKLMESEKINEMKRTLFEILEKFCIYAESKSKNRNKSGELELIEKIKQYVIHNYTNTNLAITTIADDFNVHPVYLSRLFKELSGEGLLDFINKIRIQKAKQLFKNPNNCLDDVARAVGYCSTRTFTRAFKKYEGITPGKYKALE